MKTLMAIIIAYTMAALAATVPQTPSAGGFQENIGDENIVTESVLKELHSFYSKDGEIGRGIIRAYDPGSESVTITKEDGGLRTIGMNTLSPSDQAYVREWYCISNFYQQSGFHISIKRQQSGVRSELLIWRPEEKIVYNITLENRGHYGLRDLTVDYCIHYERYRQVNGNRNAKQCVHIGTLNIGTLAGGGIVQAETRPVMIPREDLFEYYKDYEGPIGKVLGIHIRVYLPLNDGRKAIREFSTPNSPSHKRDKRLASGTPQEMENRHE